MAEFRGYSNDYRYNEIEAGYGKKPVKKPRRKVAMTCLKLSKAIDEKRAVASYRYDPVHGRFTRPCVTRVYKDPKKAAALVSGSSVSDGSVASSDIFWVYATKEMLDGVYPWMVKKVELVD